MEHKSKYGGQPEIMAAVFCYQRPMVVFDLEKTELSRHYCDNGGEVTGMPVNLFHFGMHYDLLAPIDQEVGLWGRMEEAIIFSSHTRHTCTRAGYGAANGAGGAAHDPQVGYQQARVRPHAAVGRAAPAAPCDRGHGRAAAGPGDAGCGGGGGGPAPPRPKGPVRRHVRPR